MILLAFGVKKKIKLKIKSKSDRVDQKRLTKNIFGATTFAKFNQSFLSSKISCAQMFCFTIHASLPSSRGDGGAQHKQQHMHVLLQPVVCPCKPPPKIIRLTTKTFADIIKEVKQCRCQFSSAAGRHDRADTWTHISVDILSTPTEPLASQAGSVLAMFDFKYLALRCEEEASESEPSSSHASAPQSAFDRLFAAQRNVHLPTAKQAQNKKEELFFVLDKLFCRATPHTVLEECTWTIQYVKSTGFIGNRLLAFC